MKLKNKWKKSGCRWKKNQTQKNNLFDERSKIEIKRLQVFCLLYKNNREKNVKE